MIFRKISLEQEENLHNFSLQKPQLDIWGLTVTNRESRWIILSFALASSHFLTLHCCTLSYSTSTKPTLSLSQLKLWIESVVNAIPWRERLGNITPHYICVLSVIQFCYCIGKHLWINSLRNLVGRSGELCACKLIIVSTHSEQIGSIHNAACHTTCH